MRIPGDERHTLTGGKRQHVVVAGIDRMELRRLHGIRHNLRELAQDADEPGCIIRIHSTGDFGMSQCSLHLVEQGRAHDDLELSGQPELDQTGRRVCSRDQSGDKNVCVEDHPHALLAPCLVLRVDSNAERLVLVEVGRVPDALEQV